MQETMLPGSQGAPSTSTSPSALHDMSMHMSVSFARFSMHLWPRRPSIGMQSKVLLCCTVTRGQLPHRCQDGMPCFQNCSRNSQHCDRHSFHSLAAPPVVHEQNTTHAISLERMVLACFVQSCTCSVHAALQSQLSLHVRLLHIPV
jgi:hypothetical protein